MARSAAKEDSDRRWDMHTERQISVSTAAIGAVTVLNSASWVALLTQIDKLMELPNGAAAARGILFYWGLGAAVATATWFFVYLNALAAQNHDFDRDSRFHSALVTCSQICGALCAAAAWVLFLLGVLKLASLGI